MTPFVISGESIKIRATTIVSIGIAPDRESAPSLTATLGLYDDPFFRVGSEVERDGYSSSAV